MVFLCLIGRGQELKVGLMSLESVVSLLVTWDGRVQYVSPDPVTVELLFY